MSSTDTAASSPISARRVLWMTPITRYSRTRHHTKKSAQRVQKGVRETGVSGVQSVCTREYVCGFLGVGVGDGLRH